MLNKKQEYFRYHYIILHEVKTLDYIFIPLCIQYSV